MNRSKFALLRNIDISNKAAVFLDRDGVINVDTGYVGRPDDVVLIDGIASAIHALNQHGIPVICVTNQSGIARGYYGWSDFIGVTDRIDNLLAAAGAHIDAVFASGEGPDAEHLPDSWRKPSPGMFLAAEQMLKIDLLKSLIVGDKSSDLVAGFRAGVAAGVLLAGQLNKTAELVGYRNSGKILIQGQKVVDVTNNIFNLLNSEL